MCVLCGVYAWHSVIGMSGEGSVEGIKGEQRIIEICSYSARYSIAQYSPKIGVRNLWPYIVHVYVHMRLSYVNLSLSECACVWYISSSSGTAMLPTLPLPPSWGGRGGGWTFSHCSEVMMLCCCSCCCYCCCCGDKKTRNVVHVVGGRKAMPIWVVVVRSTGVAFNFRDAD